MRLRRSDCSSAGISRVRRGRGFSYLGADGDRVDDRTRRRIDDLAIPPAWTEVWICTLDNGHLQATGLDAAGRKQYLYHPSWREQRDRQKFEDMIAFGRGLPRLRRQVENDLQRDEQFSRGQTLALAVRLLDLGLFRVGGEEYVESGGSYGLTTLRREHVTVHDGVASFDYPAKSGVERIHQIADPSCVELLRSLCKRRGAVPELLAYRDARRWKALDADDINDYLKQRLSEGASAKDFRTWNASVLAAIGVAVAAGAEAQGAAKSKQRVIRTVGTKVSKVLGNTPAVARGSYIDPRIFDRYLSGWTIDNSLVARLDSGLDLLGTIGDRRRRRVELAVIDLLAQDTHSDKIEKSSG
jgi:DNA topoisomerase I